MFPAKPGQCAICTDEIWVGGRATLPAKVDVGEAAVLFPECEHEYCATCLREWVKSTVHDRGLQFPTKCAQPECTSVLTADHLSQLAPDFVLDGATHDKYLERYLESEGKAVYCPQRGCGAFVVVDDPSATDNNGQRRGLNVLCHQCESIMCFRCRTLAHHPLTCNEFMALPEEERNPEDVAVLQIGRANLWKRCPGCQTLVERKDGCNFIKCACGEGFCYRCGKKYTHLERTAANQHGQPGCRCNLFDVPDELARELARNQAPVHVVAGHGAAAAAHAVGMQYNPYDRTADLEALLAEYAWPRHITGRRVMAHGADELLPADELRAEGRRVPPWLANYLNSTQCHYCHQRFATWGQLCNHLYTTRAHEVYMCCNRTFTHERGVVQHLQEKHGGDVGELTPFL
ncbi:hypothetical protein BCR44DRAFT_117819 [Catenaria anguillulae PL171]|uniref:RBR-type E3 ubiquitin transferase n=1 Tax=Catenaria anguillulae PL171 TaxID=765915 RepID=A0A1Y2H789_9FUNG|nr:hypothetical protein BCR44DRAFT_117819 [Catenaria anguillulae PL171]